MDAASRTTRIAMPDYYEILAVSPQASASEIETALEGVVEKARRDLNNPLHKTSATRMINQVAPAIRSRLLSGDAARAEYDRLLAEDRRGDDESDEPSPGEGLDLPVKQPFFFDPYDGYDSEIAASTLREIGQKMDSEWSAARAYLSVVGPNIHPLEGYLTFAALRPRLAARIKEVIASSAQQSGGQQSGGRVDINEVVERCIMLFDPAVERPSIAVDESTFDGSHIDLGEAISDEPTTRELSIRHEGMRGCAFGFVASNTPWITLNEQKPSVRFALMPEGSEPAIGSSEATLMLHLRLNDLERDTAHTALLTAHVENDEPVREIPIPLTIYVLPLPPRVTFDPPATYESPVRADPVRRGEIASVLVRPRNAGDEDKLPLDAAISSRTPGASTTPSRFGVDEPITLKVDTSEYRHGSTYQAVFPLDYEWSPGAHGPTALYVRGEVLPTGWQSLLRERSLGDRAGVATLSAVGGFLGLGAMCAWLASHSFAWWLVLVILPGLFLTAVLLVASTLITHIRRSGDQQVALANIDRRVLLGGPAGFGLLLGLICLVVRDVGVAFWIGALVGLLLSAFAGFVLDRTAKLSLDDE